MTDIRPSQDTPNARQASLRLGITVLASSLLSFLIGGAVVHQLHQADRAETLRALEDRMEQGIAEGLLRREADVAQIVTDRILQTELEARLAERPEIIINALQTYERAQAEKARTANIDTIGRAGDEATASGVGAEKPAVTIVMFNDYNCPYCRRASEAVLKGLDARDVRVVFREFPVITLESRGVAQVAYAMGLQGRYLDFYRRAKAFEGRMDRDSALALAIEAGGDKDRLDADVDADVTLKAIEASLEIGKAMNVTGTPTFVIGDQVVRGFVTPDQMKSLVDAARARTVSADRPDVSQEN